MSVQTVVFQSLRALVADRVYPSAFPQGNPQPAWPAIRYTVVSSDAAAGLCGTGGEEGDDVRVQIDVVALTYASMRALKTLTIAALEGTDPPCHRAPGGFETFDAETKTHRAVIDFVFSQSVNT